jgi:molybdenum cofactor cytidylyltransferase
MHKEDRITLAQALRVKRGDVVSFVGGGGKTTSMFRLAAELVGMGWRVVTTTTTHISQEQVKMSPAAIHLDEITSLSEHLDCHGQCLIIGAPDGRGRVFGASSELIAELQARTDVDAMLIEADGSRSQPFKAPGAHEPVVPATTTILVPIAGLNALDTILDQDHVHRAELAAGLAGVPVGSIINEEIMAHVLCHPGGGGKLLPPGARLVPLLNKADTDATRKRAHIIAEKLLASPLVDTVVVSSMKPDPPKLETWTCDLRLATCDLEPES